MKRSWIALLMSLLMLVSLLPVEAMAAELGEDTENTETIVETVSLPELEEQPALTATETETVEEPVIEEPVAEDPVIMEPAVEEPVAEESAAEEPSADMIETERQEGEETVTESEEEHVAEETEEIEPILADPVENSLTLEAADAGTDGIAIDEVHFPDSNFRSYVAENCDTDRDGKLSADEINAVIYVDVNSLGIHDLTGIQLFTNLTELACDSNQLTSLDVSGCTMLTWLSCFENQLTSLDVSANTSLTILDCGTNQLTSLDVRANTALTRLYCGTNQLTSLDVTHCKALTDLGCADDQLTALDVSANTAMERLWCDGNQLTSLDLRANTALEELWCDRNQLTSLDLRANTSLTVLYCNQSAASEMTETNGTYQLDLAALVGAENVDRITVTSVTPSNTQCSVSNGVLTSQTALTGLTYTYAHGGPDNGVMPVTLTLTSEGAPVPGQAHTIDDLPTEPVFDPNPNYDIWTVVEYTIEDIQADLVCTVSAKADFSEFYLECIFYGDDQMTRTVYDGDKYTILEDRTGFMGGDTPAILDIAMEQGIWIPVSDYEEPTPGHEPSMDEIIIFEPNLDYDIWTVVWYWLEDLQTGLMCTVSAKADFSEFYLECNFYGDDQMTHTVYDGNEYTILEDKTGFMGGDTPAILDIAMEQDFWNSVESFQQLHEYAFSPNPDYDIWTVVEYTIEDIQADLVCTVSAKADFSEFYLECNFYGDDQMTRTVYDGDKYTILEDRTGFMGGDTPAILNIAMEQGLWFRIKENDDGKEHVVGLENGLVTMYTNGEIDTAYTGLANYEGTWYYLTNGVQDNDFFGFTEFAGGKFLVANGTVATHINGLFQDPSDTAVWYFLSNGQAQTQYSGLALYDGAWFYLKDGILDTTFSGVVNYDGGKFLVGAGRIMSEVCGLCQDPITGTWYFFADGMVQDYTGEVEYGGANFHITHGVLDA